MATSKKNLRRRSDHPADNGGKWIRPDKRLGIYLRDALACVWCGLGVEEEPLTLDHLKPCSKGGNNEADNLVSSCRRCNSSRGDREVIEFAKAVAQYHGGGDVGEIVERIDYLTATDLTPYREEAKQIIARREASYS